MRQLPKGYKWRGGQPLAAHAHHQKSQATSSEAAAGSEGGDIFYLLSSLASLSFSVSDFLGT